VAAGLAFERLGHLLTVPVTVSGIETRFIFDTGIGPNLISESLAAKAGCAADGATFTGRRMSGQPVRIPLGSVASLDVGSHRCSDVRVGIFDMHAMAGLGAVEGFLSLSCFRGTPVTVDHAAGLVVIEDEASLARRAAAGTPVAVRVEHDGCSTQVMLGIDLPDRWPIMVEVDTGSDCLILNEALAGHAGIDLHGDGTRRVEVEDETGNAIVRYFATMQGEISVTGASPIRAAVPEVMLQKIIYDGLVGNAFLSRFTTTYDLANSRMIFAAA
jgi:predicted aspartyl protease